MTSQALLHAFGLPIIGIIVAAFIFSVVMLAFSSHKNRRCSCLFGQSRQRDAAKAGAPNSKGEADNQTDGDDQTTEDISFTGDDHEGSSPALDVEEV